MNMFGGQTERKDKHVKHANSAQFTGIPLTHITLHGGFDGISEFTDNWNSPGCPRQVTFFVSINGLLECQEGEQDGESCV